MPCRIPILLLLPLSLYACRGQDAAQPPSTFVSNPVPDAFSDYWYTGEGEISSYTLDIVRYGEERRGQAVNIFVTEPFSAEEQVKLDYPQEAGDDKVSVLKLNQVFKFTTGIYDYSMMTSVFTPVEISRYPHSLKVTTSSQDWCGQSFSQINHLNGEKYRYRLFSYFQSEGDQDQTIRPELLEDEIWTRLRINPASVPTGEVLLWPGNFFLRLSHEDPNPRAARIQFESSEATNHCIIEYLHLERTLRIDFESTFPYRILSWSVRQNNRNMVSARLIETIKTPYWQRNSIRYDYLRDSLGL